MVVTFTTYCVVEIQTDWINYNFYFALAQKIPTIPGENPYLILWKKREKLSAAYCGSFKKRTIACSAIQLLKNSHESHSAVSHHQILSLLISMSEQLWARSLVQYLTQVCTYVPYCPCPHHGYISSQVTANRIVKRVLLHKLPKVTTTPLASISLKSKEPLSLFSCL